MGLLCVRRLKPELLRSLHLRITSGTASGAPQPHDRAEQADQKSGAALTPPRLRITGSSRRRCCSPRSSSTQYV
jgi:hypothetical protein